MTTKTTIVPALAAGFIGGIVSQRLVPAMVSAQDQASVPRRSPSDFPSCPASLRNGSLVPLSL